MTVYSGNCWDLHKIALFFLGERIKRHQATAFVQHSNRKRWDSAHFGKLWTGNALDWPAYSLTTRRCRLAAVQRSSVDLGREKVLHDLCGGARCQGQTENSDVELQLEKDPVLPKTKRLSIQMHWPNAATALSIVHEGDTQRSLQGPIRQRLCQLVPPRTKAVTQHSYLTAGRKFWASCRMEKTGDARIPTISNLRMCMCELSIPTFQCYKDYSLTANTGNHNYKFIH